VLRVGDGTGDRLADPPGRVGAEAEALAPVVLLDGAHEADIALLDQIQQGETAVDVPLGDRDHQAEVGPNEELRCFLIVHLDALGKIDFLLVREERRLCDLAQVEADGIVDEVRVEALKNIQIPFEINFRLFDVAGHLRLDFFRNINLVFLTNRFGDQGIDLPNVIRLQRITHQAVCSLDSAICLNTRIRGASSML
jgi:hypothetical protein